MSVNVMVLTPEEFAALPWYARQKAVNRQLRTLRSEPPKGVQSAESAVAWAEKVRTEAAEILAGMPEDPDAAAHRRAIL